MALYRAWVCLECEYDDIEADSEEEAFEIASDAAMSGGSWQWTAERIEEAQEMNSGGDSDVGGKRKGF